MRAKSHGRYVYTERGNIGIPPRMAVPFPNKQKTLNPSDSASAPQPLEEIIMITPANARRPHIETPVQLKCPHGGVIVNGVAYCGLCAEPQIKEIIAREKDAKLRVRGHISVVPGHVGHLDVQSIPYDTAQEGVAEGFQIFLASLFNLCGRVAFKDYFYAIDYEEKKNQAFWAILSNLKTITRAKNPHGMATTIATRAITNLKRNPVYYREWSQSHLNVYEPHEKYEGEVQRVDNDFEKLGLLDYRNNPEAYGDAGFQLGIATPVFPGARDIWIPFYIEQLQDLLKEAMSQLPNPVKHPEFNTNIAIKLWVGYWPEQRKGWTYAELAEHYYQDMNERQIRYCIQNGLAFAQKYIESRIESSTPAYALPARSPITGPISRTQSLVSKAVQR